MWMWICGFWILDLYGLREWVGYVGMWEREWMWVGMRVGKRDVGANVNCERGSSRECGPWHVGVGVSVVDV